MKIKRKAGYIPVLAVMAAFTVAPVSNAMHIMEGFLAPAYCIAWGLVCVPFIVLGLRSIGRIVERDRKTMLLIAMCAAFAFVLSALKIPSVTGSCSHPTGVGLGAVFFGPLATSVFGLIVLLFQALLLGHGGITTLGANVFFNGYCRPVCFIRHLPSCKKASRQSICGGFSCRCAGRSCHLLRYFCSTWHRLSIPGRRRHRRCD